jgi:hypothetical protein
MNNDKFEKEFQKNIDNIEKKISITPVIDFLKRVFKKIFRKKEKQ